MSQKLLSKPRDIRIPGFYGMVLLSSTAIQFKSFIPYFFQHFKIRDSHSLFVSFVNLLCSWLFYTDDQNKYTDLSHKHNHVPQTVTQTTLDSHWTRQTPLMHNLTTHVETYLYQYLFHHTPFPILAISMVIRANPYRFFQVPPLRSQQRMHQFQDSAKLFFLQIPPR